ncbi:MAG: cytochrome C [Thermodesulfobacteriota bacterium]
MSGNSLKIKGIGIVLTIFAAVVTVAEGKTELTYEKDVKKIISERCLACHGSDAPTIQEFKKDVKGFKGLQKGPRMDTYSNLMIFVNGEDTGALMRRLDDGRNTRDGKPGNMYDWLGTTEGEKAANLKTIKDWVGGWTLKRKKDITAEELKAIRALK